MVVYVARDSGTDRWLGAFSTLEAAQAAAEAWVLEWGVIVDHQRLRVDRDDMLGWRKYWRYTWNVAALNVYRLQLHVELREIITEVDVAVFNVDMAEFDVDQPS
jgi:hypothetical protein